MRPVDCARWPTMLTASYRLAYVLVPITLSVRIATVYRRFHYVLDTLADAALAIAVVAGYRSLFGAGSGERQSASATHLLEGYVNFHKSKVDERLLRLSVLRAAYLADIAVAGYRR